MILGAKPTYLATKSQTKNKNCYILHESKAKFVGAEHFFVITGHGGNKTSDNKNRRDSKT